MRREVQSLLRKARRSLEAARLLHSQGYLDFAVSRAYYSMFYVAEALLLQQGLSFSSHSAVIAAFEKEFAKADSVAATFHRYLIDAQDFEIRPTTTLVRIWQTAKSKNCSNGLWSFSQRPRSGFLGEGG